MRSIDAAALISDTPSLFSKAKKFRYGIFMKAKDTKKHDSARNAAAKNHSPLPRRSAKQTHAADKRRTATKEAADRQNKQSSRVSSARAVKTESNNVAKRSVLPLSPLVSSKADEPRFSAESTAVYKTIIVGGGASGLFFAARFGQKGDVILERGERVGRKLSATGGGWGNVTNENAGACPCGENGAASEKFFGYFTSEGKEKAKLLSVIDRHSPKSLRSFLRSIGCETFADERGRVYPTSRQASSLTDCLRIEAARRGVEIKTGEYVTSVQKTSSSFAEQPSCATPQDRDRQNVDSVFVRVQTEKGVYYAENVVLCTGGTAAKNFGSDGNGYVLAQTLGHTITPLYPSIVQLKCAEKTASLKGIRVFDCALRLCDVRGEKTIAEENGDVLFTDCGVSGDAAFRLSAFLPHDQTSGAVKEVSLEIDFLPNAEEVDLARLIEAKRKKYPSLKSRELFVGIINSRVGEKIAEYALSNAEIAVKGEAAALAYAAKHFRLRITGTLSFDYAQVTKGGVLLSETDEFLQSKRTPHVYFAGEILDVDGACGGYNLQWAYSSACRIGKALFKGEDKSPLRF